MPLPKIIYGTAWKEDRTERLVALALKAGFTAIDTANQRRHYVEEGVGAAVKAAGAKREGLFLQTKFTHREGQDDRLPYDPHADEATQVRQSFESSLEHLGTTWLDSYVLHGPSARFGFPERDWRIWRAMEGLAQEGKAKALGASNIGRGQLEELWRGAKMRPAFVQNRCFAQAGWDAEVRAFCRENGIVYQGFSLLTANPHVVAHREVARLAAARKATPAQVVFAYAVSLGILPLTGTADEGHMKQDLEAVGFALSAGERQVLERLAPG